MFGFRRWPPIHGDSLAGLGGARRHGDHGPRRVADGGKPSRQTQEGHHPRALIPIFTAIPIGVFGGIYALDVLPGVLLKSLLGLTLLAFVGHSLRKTTSGPHRDSQRFATAAGALSGFTGAALSAAGPPVLIYATVAGWEKDRFRANLQAIFFVVSTISVIGLTVGNFFSESSILLSLKLIPGVLVGAMIGTKISAKIPQEVFRKIVFSALATMGLYFSLMPLW